MTEYDSSLRWLELSNYVQHTLAGYGTLSEISQNWYYMYTKHKQQKSA